MICGRISVRSRVEGQVRVRVRIMIITEVMNMVRVIPKLRSRFKLRLGIRQS